VRIARRSPWHWTDVVLILLAAVLFGRAVGAGVAALVHRTDAALSAQDRTSVEAMFGQLAFYGVAISVSLLVLASRNIDIRELGWRRPSWSWVLAAIPLTIVALAIAGILTGIAQSMLPTARNSQCTAVQDLYGHSILLALPVVCVAAPIVEETVFRGIVYRWLRSVLPIAPAMAVSAAIFAAAHAVTLLFLPLLGLGILLAWIYERSGSIWPGVLVHGLFNLVGIVDILTGPRC
jgi:membrane protease YdiL (CAAX protease family)